MTQASAARALLSTVLAPVTIVLVPVTTFGAASQAAQDSARPAVSPRDFAPMVARSIGPAGMSGRVSDIDVNPREPTTIFVGAATGGVWRSRDGGVSWQPVFDDQPVLGVGAVAVSPSNPDVVWVGTLYELTARLIMRHEVAISRQALAKHIDLLEKAGLVSSEKRGKYRMLVFNDEPLRALMDRWLK